MHDSPASAGPVTSPKDFKKKKVLWDIEELEKFFKQCKLPEGEVQLNECAKIVNVERFLTSHLLAVKNHNGNKVYQPYYNRLIRFKEIIENS
jgi:hypothetical protein